MQTHDMIARHAVKAGEAAACDDLLVRLDSKGRDERVGPGAKVDRGIAFPV